MVVPLIRMILSIKFRWYLILLLRSWWSNWINPILIKSHVSGSDQLTLTWPTLKLSRIVAPAHYTALVNHNVPYISFLTSATYYYCSTVLQHCYRYYYSTVQHNPPSGWQKMSLVQPNTKRWLPPNEEDETLYPDDDQRMFQRKAGEKAAVSQSAQLQRET